MINNNIFNSKKYLKDKENIKAYKYSKKKYIFAVLLIMGLFFTSFFIVQHYLEYISKDAQLINISGQQRMLSQKIAYSLLQNERDIYINLMEQNHKILIQWAKLNPALHDLYFGKESLDKKVRDFLVEARLNNSGKDNFLIANSGILLDYLNKATDIFVRQIENDDRLLYKLQAITLFSDVFIILVIGILFFKPILLNNLIKTEELLTEQKNNKILLDITTIANESENINNAIQETLKKVSLNMGWNLGHAYILSENDPDILVSSKIWHDDQSNTYQKFKTLSENTVFKKGEGLPGRVFASNAPAWISDLSKDRNFPRIRSLVEEQIKTAFAFPVIAQKKTIAVLEFFSVKYIDMDDISSIEIVSNIGKQLGQIYDREQAGEKISSLNKSLTQRIGELEQLEQLENISVKNAYQSGISEVTSEILHNVNNILNSMGIGLETILDKHETSALESLYKANELLRKNSPHLESFLSEQKGKQLINYYLQLDTVIKSEMSEQIKEMNDLKTKFQLIKEIISTQQSFAKKTLDTTTEVSLAEIVENALALQSNTFSRYKIAIEKKFDYIPSVSANKSKLICVVINLIKNAKEAMKDLDNKEKKLTLEIGKTQNGLSFLKIGDTGAGIAKENLAKLFNYGFTTKEDGHGFGLHSCLRTLNEIHAKIDVTSEGIGEGTQFTIVFPENENFAHQAPTPRYDAPEYPRKLSL